MKDWIWKFICFARKHPEKQLHYRFKSTKALNPDSDFDWYHEDQKAHVVFQLCTITATPKLIKNTWKHYKKTLCFYPEFYELARRLLTEGKKKDYKPHWTDMLF